MMSFISEVAGELSDPQDEFLMLYHKSKVDREAYIAFKSVNAGLERQFA